MCLLSRLLLAGAFFLTAFPGLGQVNPGTCLRFDGTNDFVSISHHPALNAFPLTVTAWVRTVRATNLVDGLVSKYADASGNGYSILLNNGTLYAFVARPGGSQVFVPPLGINGGFIADGQWHHIAFVLDSARGQLYVDGDLRGALNWTGTPGPPTGEEPLQLGRYHNYPNTFQGEMDEVTLWNRALSAGELNYLKHRRLDGKEDGLLGNWRFDEGAGVAALNSATNDFHGGLAGEPVWTTSSAALALNSIAGDCLKFDGAAGYVEVPHHTNLNAYPFTATAWFRTTNSSSAVQGIASKYADASGDGWALIAANGRLRGFYYTPSGGAAVDATSAAFVADGGWHHAALVVDASGGRLFLDGLQVGSSAWAGSASPPDSSEPLQIGRYHNYTQHFHGALDEITVWIRALTGDEIQSLRNLPLTGNETGLVACWQLNDGSGTVASDLAGQGHHGTLIDNPVWTGSTAYLGDGSIHLLVSPDLPFPQRAFAIKDALQAAAFSVKAGATFRRFHDFGTVPPPTAITFRLEAGLRVAGSGTAVAVKDSVYSNSFNLGAYNASSPVPSGVSSGVAILDPGMDLEPQTGVQLDSVNTLYEMTVAVSHGEDGAPMTADGAAFTEAVRLLHFNGRVMFGNVPVILAGVVNIPGAGAVSAPTHLQSQLQLGASGARLEAAPGVRFGGGAAFAVDLGADGTATNLSGSFTLSAPDQFFEASGIRYQLPGATLNQNGLSATAVRAWFPTGFGMTTSTNNRALLPYAARSNIVLGPNLLPDTDTLVFTAASYGAGSLYFAEETKPVLFGAPQIEWRIPQGEFFIAEAQSLVFVRQDEDRDLSAQAGNIVDRLAADRISNDGYYQNATAVPGAPVSVRPDANGASRITLQVTLREHEYRPHFPYIARNLGGHIPVVGGALAFSNSRVDPGSSYLMLAGPAPVPYARDCAPEAGCVNAATLGPQVLEFTPPPGHLGLAEFGFTPDGGLLAPGTVPQTNLTWGFIGGGNFAQRTSDIQDGACHIPGTFLLGEASGMPDAQRPAVLLLTGWGNETNAAAVERPGTAAYSQGLANYAGLNFRSPAQGRSFIAGQDTGPYPLAPHAKYYTRSGGVSGIHEAQTFPANLTLYGYPFTFEGYRLSFLDSANWESRTDGAVALPGPAGFNVEFERMKFLCRGNLDSARLPPDIGTRLMVYWNTVIEPHSLQFKPPSADPCSLSTRFLVLGVETRLPFIPQPFHTALGFKPNGNLVTHADGVEGVDSRFPVPANLSLQGPGGSLFPITTAAEGYFNNWETPGRPEAGFYSLVGRVRVPFFRDVKIHLHVTPTGPGTSQIAIMGGWAAEEGVGANRGWNLGSQNYFNTAKFDPNHNGWPTGVALGGYRNSPDETFRPRAQQNWIDVAVFDYPLAWNSVLREFSSFTDAAVILPVIDVDSRLKQLTPGKVDLDFAQDLNLALPRLKVLDLANDALNELNAPLNTLSNVVRVQLGAALDTAGLTRGFRSLQAVMRENADGWFRPLLEPALDPVVDNLQGALSEALAVSRANLLAGTAGIVTSSGNGLRSAIENLNGAAAQPGSLFGRMNGTLGDVDNTFGLFIRVLEKDGGGRRHVVRAIIQKLAEDQGPALGFVANLGDGLVNGLLSELDPTLARIETELRELRAQFNGLRGQIAGATGDFTGALNAAGRDAAALQSFLQQAGAGVSNLLASAVGPDGDYFTRDPARARREIRDRLILAFLSSPVPAKYQETFRQFLYDRNFLLNQLMDVLFDQVNRSIRDGLSSQIAGAQDSVFQGMKGSGLMTGSLLSAKIRGAPTFEGDSLRKIHLDSEIKMNLPDEMTFTAYMDIKELNSSTTPISCIPPGAPGAEVTLGARDVPLSWLGVTAGGPLALSAEARWTLQSGAVLGIGGSLEVKGKVGFKGCSINDFGASLAIGQTENYFAAKAGATVVILGIPVNFKAGIFAGHACSLEPLKFVDPEAEQVILVAGDFTGIYLMFGGGVSLSDILFGTSSCFLDVRAGMTVALYYQGGPRFGSIGGRQKVDVDVDLICVISAHADWATFMRLDTAGKLTVGGSARVCGKLGVCPFCVKACKTLVVTGSVTDGGIDYEIDF